MVEASQLAEEGKIACSPEDAAVYLYFENGTDRLIEPDEFHQKFETEDYFNWYYRVTNMEFAKKLMPSHKFLLPDYALFLSGNKKGDKIFVLDFYTPDGDRKTRSDVEEEWKRSNEIIAKRCMLKIGANRFDAGDLIMQNAGRATDPGASPSGHAIVIRNSVVNANLNTLYANTNITHAWMAAGQNACRNNIAGSGVINDNMANFRCLADVAWRPNNRQMCMPGMTAAQRTSVSNFAGGCVGDGYALLATVKTGGAGANQNNVRSNNPVNFNCSGLAWWCYRRANAAWNIDGQNGNSIVLPSHIFSNGALNWQNLP